MTFNTRRTMLPTVVSDGWAAVILWPSVRIRSMSSPKRGQGLGYRCPEEAHVSIKPGHPPPHPRASNCFSTRTTAPRNNRKGKAESPSQSNRFHWGVLQSETLGHNTETAAHSVFPLKKETTLLERSVLGLTPLRSEQGWSRPGGAPPWQDEHRESAGCC